MYDKNAHHTCGADGSLNICCQPYVLFRRHWHCTLEVDFFFFFSKLPKILSISDFVMNPQWLQTFWGRCIYSRSPNVTSTYLSAQNLMSLPGKLKWPKALTGAPRTLLSDSGGKKKRKNRTQREFCEVNQKRRGFRQNLSYTTHLWE